MSSKGKQPATILSSTAAGGSSNPSNTINALWSYLLPALEHIMKGPTNDPNKAPAINVEFYSGIHSACYNYITSSTDSPVARRALTIQDSGDTGSGSDLYKQLDQYFADTAREILLAAPQDNTTLIQYLVPSFSRYSAGALSVNRLLNYVNRHYVRRNVDEDRGWFSVNDFITVMAKSIKPGDDTRAMSKLVQEKKMDELKKWGFVEGDSGEMVAQAEASAEAASPPERVVPISSLAHRRFRIEVIEPLLAIPKTHGKKAKNKAPKSGGPPGPKGRIARAVKDLLESEGIDDQERARLALGMSKVLRSSGIRIDHPLRKKLDKFNAQVSGN